MPKYCNSNVISFLFDVNLIWYHAKEMFFQCDVIPMWNMIFCDICQSKVGIGDYIEYIEYIE